MRVIALALSLLAASAAGAQTMYRCGNTFSQQPCGPAAVEIKAPGVPQPVVDTIAADPAKTAAMQAACRDFLIRVPNWKDRDSVRVGEIQRGRLAQREISGKMTRVRLYGGFVNARNGYGGYGGDRVAVCWADEAETKILDGVVNE
jgi:hypothetical protein